MPAKKCAKPVRARPPRPAPTRPTHGRATRRLTVALATVTTATLVFLLGDSVAAHAAQTGPVLAADSVEAVVNNIRTWLVALLAAVATLFLTIGGLRLMWANGDPGEAEKGKAALKSAAIGYALALLSPLIVTVVAGWVK
jgi:Type IV secretion system pilin